MKDNPQNNLYHKYTHILKADSPEEKLASVLGESLYDFIVFSNKHLPPEATYQIKGIHERSFEFVRALYFLYPNTFVKESPEYILVYNAAVNRLEGFKSVAHFENTHFILKRDGP